MEGKGNRIETNSNKLDPGYNLFLDSIKEKRDKNLPFICLILLKMAEELQKAHLYYDDINKIRIIESATLKETEDVKDTCKDYESKVQDFGKNINSLLEMLKELGDNVEKQKMAAIGSMNLLKSIAKERESEQAKLQAEINDKTMVLEQLDSEYDALQILEATQVETIEYLTQIR